MSLPSKYAPEGLSEEDQSRVITAGSKRPQQPINYIHRINDKIHSALQHHSQHGSDSNNNYDDKDIEMIPFEDAKEVDVITSYVEYLRGYTLYEQRQRSEMMSLDDDNIADNIDDDENIATGNISYLILDTNFLISHLQLVDNLKNLAREHGLKLIIPVYVIQELDGLKSSKKTNKPSYGQESESSGESISYLARWANQWVYNSLSNARSVVKGQKLSQRLDKSLVKDDAILDCCLYFKKYYPKSLVIILSNDKNLCAKALMNDILTVSFRPNMNGELIAKKIYQENIDRFGIIDNIQNVVSNASPRNISPGITPDDNINEKIAAPSREWVEKTQQIDEFSSFHDIADRVVNEIQKVMLSALHHCMEEEYGEDLDLIRDYNENEVLTIKDCADLIIRFWSTVFSEYFRATPDKFLPFRQTDVRRKFSTKIPIHVDGVDTPGKLREFVSFWTRVLTIIYDAVMNKAEQEALEVLIARWTAMANKA